VGRLDEDGAARHVLLVDPVRTPAAPLLDALLLAPGPASARFRQQARLGDMTLSELL
jgi:membrane protein